MSDTEPTKPIPVPSDDISATAEAPVVGANGAAPDPVVDPGADIHPEDPDDEWNIAPAHNGIRLGVPTAVLTALVVLAAGFWGGALAEQHHNPSTSSTLSALTSRLRAGRGGAGGFGAFGGTGTGGSRGAGAGGAAGAAATGIVTGVEGPTLYLTSASGALIKVTLAPGATVQRTASTALAGLQTGDTVTVQGTRNTDGTVTARTITDTAQALGPGSGGG